MKVFASMILFAAAALARRVVCTAIVVPHQKEKIADVLDMMTHWRSTPPFLQSQRHVCVELVFFSNKELTIAERKLVNDTYMSFCDSCLDIHFLNAALQPSEEGYPRGPNNMFRHLISTKVDAGRWMHANFDFFFLFEPDCYPIRPNWGLAIAREVANMGTSCVRGSLYYGAEGWSPSQRADVGGHINGNAMYKLSCSDLWDQVDTLIFKNPDRAYDVLIFKEFLKPALQTVDTAYFFSYSRIVLNYGGSPYNSTRLLEKYEHAFIVHGPRDAARGVV